jgi:alkanesulfonate monooxygenase
MTRQPEEFELVSSATQIAPETSDAGATRLIETARRAEADGVDSLLTGYTSTRPDGWMLAAYILSATTSINVLLAHRPGVMSPNAAARMAGTLDVLSGGRLALNVISGGSAADQMREGDFLGHDERYERAIEYVGLLKRLWTEDAPFDHEGTYYRLVNASNSVKPFQSPHPTIYMGGASEPAKQFAVAQADAYMSWSEPVAQVKQRFDELRGMFAAAGRPAPRFSLSMRLILGETEDEAWATAESLLPDDIEERRKRDFHREDVGRNRQLGLAKESFVHDERLWMGLAAATGGQGSTGALVGTVEQVQESLLRYVAEAGANTLLLTGPGGAYEPFPAGFVASLRARANAILAEQPAAASAPR